MKTHRIILIFFVFNLMMPMYGMSMFSRVRERLQPGVRSMSNKVSPTKPVLKKGVSPARLKVAFPDKRKNTIDVVRKQVARFLKAQYARLSSLWKTEPTSSTAEVEKVYDSIIEPMFTSKLKSVGNNRWQSPAGILYVEDKKFGNTLNHVLAHLIADPTKKNHTVFNVPKESIIELIDEAWMLKGNALPLDPRAYIVDMKRIIGTNGETGIRIVLTEPGTVELLTAYPVKI